MSDLIDRQAAEDIVYFECGEWRGLAKTIIHSFEVLPTAERKGHWIRQTDKTKKLYGWLFCSECGAVIGEPTKFCSECGTRMEREDG